MQSGVLVLRTGLCPLVTYCLWLWSAVHLALCRQTAPMPALGHLPCSELGHLGALGARAVTETQWLPFWGVVLWKWCRLCVKSLYLEEVGLGG